MKKIYLIDYYRINNYNLDDPFKHKITAYSTMKNAWRALLLMAVEEPTKTAQYIESLGLSDKDKPEWADISLPKLNHKFFKMVDGKITVTAQILETNIITGVKME